MKVTVCALVDPSVVKLMIVSSAEKEEIIGAWLSILLTVTFKLALDELPTVSVTVATTLSVLEP